MSAQLRCIATAFLFIFYSSAVNSSDTSWKVQPKVCIVEKLGTICEMELEIQLNPLDSGIYCYYQDSEILKCWPHDNPITELRIRFSQATVLYLKDQQQKTLFQHKLGIKARELNRKTRRVRQPWSLF